MLKQYVPEKAKWYFSRLTSMSVDEVFYRIQQRTNIEIDRRFSATEASWQRDRQVVLPSQPLEVKVGLETVEHETVRQTYIELYPENYEALIHKAEALLEHKMELFGFSVDLGKEINWHQDPKTKRIWPREFWANIDIRDGSKIGGVKWVWELNRHHHLVTLAKAFYLTDDEKYAHEVCSQLRGWISTNPVHVGVNWTTSLEPAIRLINWTWVLAFLSSYDSFDESLLQDIYGAIDQQANYIFRYESKHSSANNHLIGEAAGLVVAGLSFPFLNPASKWAEHGLRTLEREVGKQILEDGTSVEQAFHYLAFTLDFCLIAWRVAELNSLPLPPIWVSRLESAADFLCSVMDEKGMVPHIGDSDDAWVLCLDDLPHPNNFSSLVTSASFVCNNMHLQHPSCDWDEKNFWLFGPQGKDRLDTLTPSEQDPLFAHSKLLPDGGYAILRSADRLALFDWGPLGYLSTAAHGHADALSLTITLGDQPVLIDSGTYAYQEGGAWRDFLRSTRAHNTIVIDDCDQSEMLGAFLWGQRANATLLQWDFTDEYDLVVAEHDGYAQFGIIHRRAILFGKPDCIIVMDWIFGSGTHKVEQLWHFSPESQIDWEGRKDASITIQCNHKHITIVALEREGLEVSTCSGKENPLQGWASSTYAQISPAPVVALSGHVSLPFQTSVAFDFGACERSRLTHWRDKLLSLLQL
ncbi:MAG: alginate lyase family protein [Chloroflexota bacterium]